MSLTRSRTLWFVLLLCALRWSCAAIELCVEENDTIPERIDARWETRKLEKKTIRQAHRPIRHQGVRGRESAASSEEREETVTMGVTRHSAIVLTLRKAAARAPCVIRYSACSSIQVVSG
jgi:hypothetical protein